MYSADTGEFLFAAGRVSGRGPATACASLSGLDQVDGRVNTGCTREFRVSGE